MSTPALNEAEIQREYYAKTACNYDGMHTNEGDENAFAMHVMFGMATFLDVETILDIGSGTGRTLIHAKTTNLNFLSKVLNLLQNCVKLPIGKVYQEKSGLKVTHTRFHLKTGLSILCANSPCSIT